MMSDDDPPPSDFIPSRLPWGLRPAETGEAAEILKHAFRFEGRKRSNRHDEMMATITADHVLKALEQSGFVLMRKPPSGSSTGVAHWMPDRSEGSDDA